MSHGGSQSRCACRTGNIFSSVAVRRVQSADYNLSESVAWCAKVDGKPCLAQSYSISTGRRGRPSNIAKYAISITGSTVHRAVSPHALGTVPIVAYTALLLLSC